MRDVFVAGAATTAFGKYLDRSVRTHAEQAVREALADAGGQPDDVDAVYFANASGGVMTGQEMIRGQVTLRRTGLLGVPMVNVENACASGSTAVHLAWVSVASGAVDVAMAIGAEKMTHADKARTIAALDGAVDPEEHLDSIGQGGRSRSLFMDLYARTARRYMEWTGATAHDFAEVAVKSHANAAHNAKAQYRESLTVDEVLGSRSIAEPLTLPMCSPVGDGAAALVLASEVGLRRLDAEAVQVLASAVLSTRDNGSNGASAVTRAAFRAYAHAEITPEELDVVELHDAAAPAELVISEELGLAEEGGGGVWMLRSGDSQIGGRLPLNPSGGLLAKGHPIGATGCAQIVELADQIRGRCGGRQVAGAEIGLAENSGGWLGDGPAVATITILRGT